MSSERPGLVRNLVVVLGDQLDAESAAFDGFDPARDAVWMAEVAGESTHVWSHRARIALFLSAMRHFRDRLRARGWRVEYRELEEAGNAGSLGGELTRAVGGLRPERLVVVEPGEWRVERELEAAAAATGLALEVRTDRHFLGTRAEFAAHAGERKQLRMEYFYREMRRRHGVLMDGGKPLGGEWNYDAANRDRFGSGGPGAIPEVAGFEPDAVTRGVLGMVAVRFGGHPGSLEGFDWPVTREQALVALGDFIEHRLPSFGRYQDAMWAGEGGGLELELGLGAGVASGPGRGGVRRDAYLHHSRLSAALNLKLLNPREVVAAAERAYREGQASLESVEGFVRQILGWREYVRGIYQHHMPEYAGRNALGAEEPLPGFYWTGRTDMRCLRLVIGQTLAFGYAHHIQRLMVTGLFALLLGVRPAEVHGWYLAVYVDAVEWVELPNTVGMSQYADGGLMASKPYVASGKYIQRMSNYCDGCVHDPGQATGKRACPFTTLYWDFLLRHEALLRRNPRMAMQLRNLGRLDAGRREEVRRCGDALRAGYRAGGG